jgi:catechol 2,3-dioxygenase-like lactoylglutathione lyase family enzyme
MTTKWTVTLDCTDVPTMLAFWRLALGYVEPTPPEGWTSWEDWLRDMEVPAEEWADGGGLDDPDGVLPSLSFLKVPEPKSSKNRLHIDLQVSGGRHLDADLRRERIEAKVDELTGAGATVLDRSMQAGSLDHVVMADPEGNEFCVV